MAPHLARALAVALAAVASASDLPPQDLPEALALDDECQAGAPCALNAVQLRGQLAAADDAATETIRILHLSDTHNMHHQIEGKFPLPDADILIHTGDFTNDGTSREFASANAWLGTLKGRYKHILAITGNHDWYTSVNWVGHKRQSARYATEDYWQKRLSNAKYLDGGIEVMGLSIFASPWKGEQHPSAPDDFGEIPTGVDILMVHGPPKGILDWTGGDTWGSSDELLADIKTQQPKVVLFGHVHEARGLWVKDNATGEYAGGGEYKLRGKDFPTDPTPPSKDLAPQIISNNAMLNAPGKDGEKGHIIAPARVILATKVDGAWQFKVEEPA